MSTTDVILHNFFIDLIDNMGLFMDNRIVVFCSKKTEKTSKVLQKQQFLTIYLI